MKRFVCYLLVRDEHLKKDVVDLSTPVAEGNFILDVISQSISLREDRHIGFQVFDTTQWTFSRVISF